LRAEAGRGTAAPPGASAEIRQLPESVAARIAAGEVVERPASIVKELVENALDAGATRVDVAVSGGGLELTRVADDGCGVDPEQLELAFSRHATSKLSSDQDLFAVASLGFRGEALPSIAAVAEVELVSRTAGDESGAVVVYRYGDLVRKSARASPLGTTVTVKRLFARQPARLKFLRSRSAEYQQIGLVVDHYALARADVAFSLAIDGRASLASSGSGDSRQALAAVYGADVARRLIEVAPTGDERIAVRGWIAPPDLNRATRQDLSLFVNGRWVQNRRLLFALDDAFQGLLPRGRHPIAAVMVTLPLSEVDVNAHPTKAEVRFRDEGAVFAAIQRALRETLSEFAPPATMGIGGDQGWPAIESVAAGLNPAVTAADNQFLTGLNFSPGSTWNAVPTQKETVTAKPGDSLSSPARSRLPLLRILGQMGSTYIVCEGPDGMYMLDQHAAHERVLFDVLSARNGQAPDAQALLVAEAVEVGPAQAAALHEFSAELEAGGWQLGELDGGNCLLRAVPAGLGGRQPAAALLEFLDALISETSGPDRTWRVQATLACHAAVRAGTTMSPEEMRALVEQLEESAEPLACPHGRPTLVHLPVETLDRQFGRTWR
jgi:DNA mismatch repair protein MutL